MIGKRVLRCNEHKTLHFSLPLDGKLCRFLTRTMKQKKYTLIHIRQSAALRMITLAVLFISIITSVSHEQRPTSPLPNRIQKIVLPDLVPAASPGHISKVSSERELFSWIKLDYTDPEEHILIFSARKLCSPDHARLMSRFLVYTQTTSSFL
jgi:hypothetical protein